jgi:hypothetical protein
VVVDPVEERQVGVAALAEEFLILVCLIFSYFLAIPVRKTVCLSEKPT